jgi:N4-gp56 family major capsid protein
MASTVIPWGDPKAQKKWSANLAIATNHKSYFKRRGFIGKGDNNIIEEKVELKDDAGDRISFDLSVQLRQSPTFGDARVKGKEEHLRFYTDEVVIDQMRHSVSAGGRMSRKRTIHDLRVIAKNRLADYWKQYIDDMMFIYLAGARGINDEFIQPLDYTGFASNPLVAPDAQHIVFGGAATAKAEITTADVMSRALIERVVTHSTMIRATDPEAQNLQPVDVDGSQHYVMVMSPFQEYTLRTASSSDWVEIQKAAAAAEGRKSPLFTGGLGMINNTILHAHASAIRFSDYGAGANLAAARALYMGRQAGVVAYGTPQGARFDWKEEMEDYGNEPTVVAGVIMGFKKTRFNGRDFGMIAVDTYAPPVSG